MIFNLDVKELVYSISPVQDSLNLIMYNLSKRANEKLPHMFRWTHMRPN